MTPHGIVLKNCDLYAPEPLGMADLTILDGKFLSLNEDFSTALKLLGAEVKVIDCEGALVLPGLVDAHVHFGGAGGEGGAVYRTPPLQLSELTSAGITSAVGLLGTDGYCRSLRELLMKARALEEEGLSTWIFTGSYQIPGPTITGDVASDILLIDKVIGLKLACSDHRASQVPVQDLQKAAAESRVGGILAGKCGLVMVHIGEGEKRLEPFLDIASHSDIPLSQFIPTHLNRSESVFQQAISYGLAGGRVDISSGVSESCCFPGAVKTSRAAARLLEAGVPLKNVTMSSDGNGVMTRIDSETGEKLPLMAPVHSMIDEFLDMLKEEMPVEKASRICSANMAEALRLPGCKGHIQLGGDADLIVVDKSLKLRHVIAKGSVMFFDAVALRKGLFEK